jgi:hypothetical protein
MRMDHEDHRPDGHLDRPCTCDAWWVQTESRRRSEAPRSLGGTNRDQSQLATPGSWFPMIREIARCIESDPHGTADRIDAETYDLADQYLREEARALKRWNDWEAKNGD